ncbi:major capsid protein [Pararhodospirillum photometricum]|uniref:major capsid protein n=1 Tax=Pararhodospirillum photometricum TaxID=1084 RepID=UPI0003171B8C|nr:major capsid protein [Pararhodospirillum photometricum]
MAVLSVSVAASGGAIGEKRKVRGFKTVRLAQASRIHASELQNIRAFGSESELAQVQVEVARRQVLMRRDFELTFENMFLGMVQGLAVDADGSTLYDWATEFGQTIPAEIDFDLDNATPASGAVRKKCNAVVRSILQGLRGLGGASVRVVALCGDAFWDDLTAHKEVRETYLNTQMAADLRQGNAYETFSYGGITFVNYRGTDDGSTVVINTDKARFFPVGAGIFQWALSPGESFDFVNQLGQELYSAVIPDRDRNAWADVEMYSYPLPVCTMPQALHRAKRT